MFHWMLYACAVSTLLGAGAWIAECAARRGGAPLRWIWALAVTLSMVVPAAMSAMMALKAARNPAPIASVATPTPATHASTNGTRAWILLADLGNDVRQDAAAALRPHFHVADTTALWTWATLSSILVAALAASILRLARLRRDWRSIDLAGERVMVSDDMGPAVIGMLHPRIVIPQWLLAAPEETRRLVMAHEQSHLRAGDPRLLLLTLMALVAMPWNLPLWWQSRRLRAAIEIDCDTRVVGAGNDIRSYGTALVDIGTHRGMTVLAALTMTEPQSLLERRIAHMKAVKLSRWHPGSMAMMFFAASTAVAATQMEPPVSVHKATVNALDQYLGKYEFSNTEIITVSRNGSQLQVSFGSETPVPVFPGYQGEYYYRDINAQLSFVKNASGQIIALTFHQNGADTLAQRIDEARVAQIKHSIDERIQAQKPDPRSEPALRRLIDGIAAENPPYDELSPQLVAATRQQLPGMRAMARNWGALKAVTFRKVNAGGWDEYAVSYEHATVDWSLTLDGKGIITGALFGEADK